MKKSLSLVLASTLLVAGATSLASCGQKTTTGIKIGIYNQAGWPEEGQPENVKAYADYLAANLKYNDAPVFEFVYSATKDLTTEVNSFVTQSCDAVLVLNTECTSAVEAICADAEVYYMNISNEVTAAKVGTPSEYCLGGVKNYFGDTSVFAKLWMDDIKADMAANNITTAKVTSVEFPVNINSTHQDVLKAMRELAGKGEYTNITFADKYYRAAGVPLANYLPSNIAELKTDIENGSGVNYVLGLANGAKTLTPTFTQDYNENGVLKQNGVRLLTIGYQAANLALYDSFLVNQAEAGLEGLVAGLARIYQAKNGTELKDVANYKNSDGIVNIPTAWHSFQKKDYNNFVSYMYGGQAQGTHSDYSKCTPAIDITEFKEIIESNKLETLATYTNRTVTQVAAKKGSKA